MLRSERCSAGVCTHLLLPAFGSRLGYFLRRKAGFESSAILLQQCGLNPCSPTCLSLRLMPWWCPCLCLDVYQWLRLLMAFASSIRALHSSAAGNLAKSPGWAGTRECNGALELSDSQHKGWHRAGIARCQLSLKNLHLLLLQ